MVTTFITQGTLSNRCSCALVILTEFRCTYLGIRKEKRRRLHGRLLWELFLDSEAAVHAVDVLPILRTYCILLLTFCHDLLRFLVISTNSRVLSAWQGS